VSAWCDPLEKFTLVGLEEGQHPKGKVYLVGAGPGDPDLLTIKASKIIQSADVILYDSLIGPEILKFASPNARRIFVGKRAHSHSYTQDQINEMILEEASKHHTVVRLKGGDPFIFGRGGEEIQFLREHGIELEVIPGVTAATAASALLQSPLTHRDLGASVVFLSGYSRADRESDDGFPHHDWKYLASSSLTLVFYMGQHHLSRICQSLIEAGREENTSIALVSNISLPEESVTLTTISHARDPEVSRSVRFPAVAIVGDVLRMMDPALKARIAKSHS